MRAFLFLRCQKMAVFFFLFIAGTSLYCKELPRFVTYEFSGGRFGDNLISYLHAKWISYKYEIPLLYKPFPYSFQLALHDQEILYSMIKYRYCQAVPLIKDGRIFLASINAPLLYICPYFPECQWERENTRGVHGKSWDYFDVDWKDPGFNQLLKQLVAPKQKQILIIPPKDTINIAIHIRDGGTFDTVDFNLRSLTKFPSVDFYIEGLLKIIELFPQKPLYCYIFTDAVNPAALAEKIRGYVPPGIPITFEYRSKDNTHSQNVLEDFFSLFQFDVLIHPQSNFSVIPTLIHDYAVVYAPLSGFREGAFNKIDRVKFEINQRLYQELIK